MFVRILMLVAVIGSLEAAPIPQLAALKWMEGTWIHESEGTTVRMISRWTDGGRFLERNFSIQLGSEPLKKMRQTVFWDPARKEVRSWGCYSDGSFEESVWKIKDGTIEIQREITYADGTRGKAVNTLGLVDAKNCTWSSSKRRLGWEKLPDIPTTTLFKE